MKACAFCAEEIQDAAIFCKHCNRDQPNSTSRDHADRSGRGARIAVGIGVLIVLAGGATAGLERHQANIKSATDSVRRAAFVDSVRVKSLADSASHERELAVLDSIREKAATDSAEHAKELALHESMLRAERRAADSVSAATPRVKPLFVGSVSVPNGGYRLVEFAVPNGSRCAIAGDAEGTNGTFEILVLTYDQLVAWQANSTSVSAVWRSGLTSKSTPDVQISKPGRYGAVLSNRAAWLLTHTIKSDVELTCKGVWPPLGNGE